MQTQNCEEIIIWMWKLFILELIALFTLARFILVYTAVFTVQGSSERIQTVSSKQR